MLALRETWPLELSDLDLHLASSGLSEVGWLGERASAKRDVLGVELSGRRNCRHSFVRSHRMAGERLDENPHKVDPSVSLELPMELAVLRFDFAGSPSEPLTTATIVEFWRVRRPDLEHLVLAPKAELAATGLPAKLLHLRALNSDAHVVSAHLARNYAEAALLDLVREPQDFRDVIGLARDARFVNELVDVLLLRAGQIVVHFSEAVLLTAYRSDSDFDAGSVPQ